MENWLLKKKYISQESIKNNFELDDIICELISKRDFKSQKEIYEYLNPSTKQLHNPFLLKGMNEAIEIIKDDIKKGNLIYLALDYDVDGIISGAISYLGLKKLGANCKCILPHRVKDGYGLNTSIIKEIKNKGGSTVITFDNGIAAFDAVDYAKELGLKIIVTDHHDVPFVMNNGEKIYNYVNSDVIINPKQVDCHYPFKGLCGGAIAYKLIEALGMSNQVEEGFFKDIFPLAALATICDVMELKNENRTIVALGLKEIMNLNNPGLKSLLQELDIVNTLTPYDVGFKIGPCFNSSGRLETAEYSLELLVRKTEKEGSAKYLVELNETRKHLTKEGAEKAFEIIEKEQSYNHSMIVVFLEYTHESIAGIIASRVKERYNRPTIVITRSEEGLKGSARSIEGFNVFEHISKYKEFLVKFGGHPMAAGLSLKEENLNDFKRNVVQGADDLNLNMDKKIRIDTVVEFKDLNLSLAKSLEILEPFGKGNEKPVFATKDVNLISYTVLGKNKNVLKIKFKDKSGEREFIAFNNVDKVMNLFKKRVQVDEKNDIISFAHSNFDIIFNISTNIFRGEQRLQLELISIR